ncbi:hypothetical protein GHK58_22745 [Sinorhizobium meliloti]|uniref:hypothetical protein n=1 Tax=Rhizobium meliloti TaxID=382 RepID=UPI0012968DAD|nr:hypothetical protein [Sinorhizobium meliloti]MQX42960.1 hypothetical protein [Sinorhizobium meliloti]
MIELQQVSFHEATIRGLSKVAQDAELELDDVLVQGKRASANVKVFSVSSISVDGIPSSVLAMEADDGEVLTLDTSGEGFFLIAEWNDFAKGKSTTKSYHVVGRSMVLTVT